MSGWYRSIASKDRSKERPSPMSLGELYASIRERRRRSAQQSYEEGAQIRRRLQELLAVPSAAQQVEAPSPMLAMENEPAYRPTIVCLNLGFSERPRRTKADIN